MPGLGEHLRCVTFRDADGDATSAFVPAAAPGPRTPVFFVPALGLDGRSFAPLEPLATERRVVFWSPPNALPRAPGLDAFAATTIAHADRAGMPRRFVLAGSSLGGVMALAAALAAPERVAGLVLIGAVARWTDLGPPMRLARLLHPFLPRRSYHMSSARILAPGHADPGSLTAELRKQMEHRNKDYAAAVLAALTRPAKFDLSPRLPALSVPTLIVHARGDRISKHRSVRTLATIPGSQVVTIEGGSHLPYLHDPNRFLDALRPFLAAVDENEVH